MLEKSSLLKLVLVFNECETAHLLSGHHEDFELHCKSYRMSSNNCKQGRCSERFLWMLPRSGLEGTDGSGGGRGMGYDGLAMMGVAWCYNRDEFEADFATRISELTHR